VASPLLVFLLFQIELSYDFFAQEVLDMALHQALREIATGNAQNAAGATAFMNSYFCPATHGLLNCNNLWFSIQKLPSPLGANQDYYTYTTGSIPTSAGNKLNLANFSNNSGSGITNFCNSGPAEMLLVSAVYVGPSFVGGLLPNTLTYTNYLDNSTVTAAFSTAAIVTEAYLATAASPGETVASSC
jgi:Flp pilus assembly protein TadG